MFKPQKAASRKINVNVVLLENTYTYSVLSHSFEHRFSIENGIIVRAIYKTQVQIGRSFSTVLWFISLMFSTNSKVH